MIGSPIYVRAEVQVISPDNYRKLPQDLSVTEGCQAGSVKSRHLTLDHRVMSLNPTLDVEIK